MKKSISILLAILLIFSISACSVQKEPAKESEENTVSQTEQSTENVLEFNRDTYEKSVQVNQKELHWATYNDLPSEIIIERDELIADTPWIIKTPAWEKYEFDQTVLLNNQPDYVMYTFGTEDADYQEITVKNSIPWKDLVDWKQEVKKDVEINGFTAALSSGKCYLNNNARNEKLFVMIDFKDVNIHGCIIAITEAKAFHTIDDMKNMVMEMAESIRFANETAEEE